MASLADPDLTVAFTPSPTQRAFIYDPTFLTGYFGPFGCGKTTALCQKAWALGQAFPGIRIGIFRATYPALRDTTMASWFHWFPPEVAGEHLKTDNIFRLLTRGAPSWIYFRHLDTDQDISKALSLELACAGFDEPQGGINTVGGMDPGISVNLYRALLGRIDRQRGFPGLAFMTGNSPSPDHFLAHEFGYDGHGAPTNPYPDRHLYLGTRQDNVAHLNGGDAYYQRLERIWGVNTPLAQRFLEGRWVSMGVEKPFQSAWIQRWGPGTDTPELPPAFTDDRGGHPGYIVECGFDPAISEKDTAARSALVVAAQVRHPSMRGRLLILEGIAGHWSVWQQVRQILNAVVRWKARTVRVEDVAYQKSLKDILDREARTRGVHVHIELVKPDGDKLRRANAWSPLVEDGTVLFPTTGAEDLIACMLAVPGDSSRWDPVDAAGLCVRGFPPLEAARTRLTGSVLSTPERAESYALRGRGMPLSAVVTWEKFGARTPDLRRRAQGYAQRRPS